MTRKHLPIVDSFKRVHSNMRISVTDRCNIRCVYCMPESVRFLPQRDVLTFEEIVRLVRILVPLGVDRYRLTGGEPLVRSQLDSLIGMIKQVKGVQDLAITTNAVLLADQAMKLKQAGLDRVNISLDTVDSAHFHQVTRRDELPRVLAGIEAARNAGFERIRINAVPVPLLPDDSLVELARFCRTENLELRFIEFMPLDADQNWSQAAVRSGDYLRELISTHVGQLEPAPRHDASQPATDYQYTDGGIRIGFIDSVTHPFCATCNRMRITAEGKFRNCLFSQQEWDLKTPLRFGTDEDVERIVREAVAAKKAGHGTNDGQFLRPEKAMYQIGG